VDEKEWFIGEFSAVDLGDERLNYRLVQIAGSLAKSPGMSINQACGSWSESKAAYRFFSNSRFEGEDILEPHIEETARRMENEKVVLAVQDGTSFNFSKHQATRGLGSIGEAYSQSISGLNVHTTLAVSAEGGESLGVLSQKVWTRHKKPTHRAKTPIKKKESYKWIEALNKTTRKTYSSATQALTI